MVDPLSLDEDGCSSTNLIKTLSWDMDGCSSTNLIKTLLEDLVLPGEGVVILCQQGEPCLGLL